MLKAGVALFAILILLGTTPLSAEENQDLIGTVLFEAPTTWTSELVVLPIRGVGSLFGLEGDPALNENYGGYDGKFGYYESFSDESFYRYQRWGVN